MCTIDFIPSSIGGFLLNYRFKRLKLGTEMTMDMGLLINLVSGGSGGFVVVGKVVNCGKIIMVYYQE